MMKQRFLSLFVMAVVCLLYGLMIHSCESKPRPVDGTFVFDRVPFITVMMKGKPETFIMDTGASVSVIDKEYADREGIWYVDDGGSMITFSGTEQKQYKTERNVEFIIGDVTYSQPFMVQDIGKLRSFVGRKVRGVIGSDFLYGNKVVIDFGNLVLTNLKTDEVEKDSL